MCIRDRSWTPANTRPASATATKTSPPYPWSDTTSTATGTTPCCPATRHSDWTLFLRGALDRLVAVLALRLRAALVADGAERVDEDGPGDPCQLRNGLR